MNFQTIKVLNFQLALYMLSMRAPEPPFLPIQTFIFPISPQRVRKVMNAMAMPYDTAGTPLQAGVNREVDRYGTSPFTYEVEGTTGWDLHMTDGFSAPGLIAAKNLQNMFIAYDENNALQRLNNNPYSYTMEWADFFTGEYYQVEPSGPIEIHASERAPLLQYFRFRLIGIQPIAAPLIAADLEAVDILFSSAPASVLTSTLLTTAAVLSLY